MMTDRIETFGQSTIHHGKHSDRVYLMKLGRDDLPELLTHLEELANRKGYTKIFAKVPDDRLDHFRRHGYRPEARVPRFYRGDRAAHFLGKYLCPQRREEPRPQRVAEVLELARAKETLPEAPSLTEGYRWRPLDPSDTQAMVAVYRRVFASYPFPIHNPAYLEETMADNVRYHGIFSDDRLVAVASAELDTSGGNGEMTDFATLPEERGKGLANYLLTRLEEAAAHEGIVTAYTIARAYSFGMNITFAKLGYDFGGTLTRNTQISGDLESMNVWYKPLVS